MADLRPYLLFLHFLSLAGALGTSAMLHHALVRLRRAGTTGEALAAVQVLKRNGARMPLWALALFVTGAAVAQASGLWGAPFVGAGIAGLAAMLVISGAILKRRLMAVARRLATATEAPLDASLVAAVRDSWLWTAALVNPALAYAIMFDMVVKPDALGCAVTLLVAVIGAAAVGLLGRSTAVAPAAEEAAA